MTPRDYAAKLHTLHFPTFSVCDDCAFMRDAEKVIGEAIAYPSEQLSLWREVAANNATRNTELVERVRVLEATLQNWVDLGCDGDNAKQQSAYLAAYDILTAPRTVRSDPPSP